MPDFKKFNDPKFLLTKKDLNKETPEVFLSCGNRGAGKTYGYSWVILENALGRSYVSQDILPQGKFCLICRWEKEVAGIAKGVFDAMVDNEYTDASITSVMSPDKLYANVFFNQPDCEPIHVGYVAPINKSDDIKKISSVFHDVAVMVFDEFQCASASSYVPDEVDKFIRMHISMARGGGKSSRYLPVIMLSNSVSITNPYFTALRIHDKIQSNTKLLKGDSFVLERFTNPNAANEQRESGFNRAFAGSKELDFSIDNTWLNDDTSCIAKPDGSWGRSIYYYTLVKNNEKYGVREFPGMGLWTISNSVDGSCQYIYNITTDGGNLNIPMLKKSPQMKMLRELFENGQMRFPNQGCKQVALDLFV